MNVYMYDSKTNAFYPVELRAQYEKSGTWPTNGIEVNSSVFNEFTRINPGKVRAPGSDGLPVWVDTPAPTESELMRRVESQRAALLANADLVIADWRTELMLDEISDENKTRLSAWMAHKREVKAVSAIDAMEPDFKWPSPPPPQ